MSRQSNEANERQLNKLKQKADKPLFPNMFTFHPTVEEKRTLQEREVDPIKDLSILSQAFLNGCMLTIGVRIDTGSYYATIREKTDDWKNAKAISAWHSLPDQALAGLAYCLEVRFPDFPHCDMGTRQWQDEW